jgi:alpha-glucosidase
VQNTSTGLCADLTLAGPACNIYGNDIADLTLVVEYQRQQRLAVRIYPKHVDSSNSSHYILDSDVAPQPIVDDGYDAGNSDLVFTWSNDPSFAFKVARKRNGEVLFDTTGNKLVFEDRFLELSTSMVDDYNIYGLAESLHSFRLGTNWTQTFWASYNLDNDNVIDVNGHSTQPMYLETRYPDGGGESSSHGVYARNAHGQDWLLRPDRLTYRTIGGSFDLYFLSGDKPTSVISQYHTQIIGTPYLQPYWTLGFMQVRWGYQNWTNLQEVIDLYANAGIQLEMIANDLDYLSLNRLFTTDSERYSLEEGKALLEKLHANGQYYFPILDPNVYVPNPTNDSDSYPPYDRAVAQNALIQNGDQGPYYGVLWSGLAAYVDHVTEAGQQYWADEIVRFKEMLDFDGFWLDVNDATSFCTGSCGTGMLEANPIHVPFALPGDPDSKVAVSFDYPEMFNVTNSTEAASASSALASQSSAYPMTSTATTTHLRTSATPGVRQLNFPPYAVKNDAVPGNSLVKQVISPNATHNDAYKSTEYDLHNLYGHMSTKSTFNGLKAAKPGVRPFVLARSTFAGTGTFAGHWGGDTGSTWGNMYFGIGQALAMSIAGIPYFGVETCGFRGNADMELCTRWMQLSAWYPLYRNHNSRNTIAQEAYQWSTTAEATRRIVDIRYSLLPYTYTLFHHANTKGETVLRALSWEFPNDPSLKAVETQFMSGPALLVTPVLAPLATSVQGVFPGIADGQTWYDWYTLEAVNASAGENKTLDAPLEHQPIHIRGGFVIPVQAAQNTTAMSRKSPWSLIVALDKNGFACGDLYLDDGVSISPQETKSVQVSFFRSKLDAKSDRAVQNESRHSLLNQQWLIRRWSTVSECHHRWSVFMPDVIPLRSSRAESRFIQRDAALFWVDVTYYRSRECHESRCLER